MNESAVILNRASARYQRLHRNGATAASYSRTIRTVCSSLNLGFLMVPRYPRGLIFSGFDWCENRPAGDQYVGQKRG
jgi:hypothetical protein